LNLFNHYVAYTRPSKKLRKISNNLQIVNAGTNLGGLKQEKPCNYMKSVYFDTISIAFSPIRLIFDRIVAVKEFKHP